MRLFDRVQVPAYTDAWMSGDRYGMIVAIPIQRPRNRRPVSVYTAVRLDKSERVQLFKTADLETV